MGPNAKYCRILRRFWDHTSLLTAALTLTVVKRDGEMNLSLRSLPKQNKALSKFHQEQRSRRCDVSVCLISSILQLHEFTASCTQGYCDHHACHHAIPFKMLPSLLEWCGSGDGNHSVAIGLTTVPAPFMVCGYGRQNVARHSQPAAHRRRVHQLTRQGKGHAARGCA
jgi:hypothetical protein